jgi:hypothetical protein
MYTVAEILYIVVAILYIVAILYMVVETCIYALYIGGDIVHSSGVPCIYSTVYIPSRIV